MAQKTLKNCSTILHQKYANQNDSHLTAIRLAKIKTQGTADASEDVEKEEHSSIAGGTARGKTTLII